MSKIRIFNGFWSVADCMAEPTAMFIFGDNDVKIGKKGQAIIRDCSNAIGIPTKKYPSLNTTAFYTDDEIDSNKEKIRFAINNIIALSVNYSIVYLPSDPIGSGLAKLPEVAPKTYRYLQRKIEYMKSKI